MRIVFAADYYSDGMGYSENVLPRTLAALGHEVFLVGSTMQVYGDHPFYDEVYGRFLGKAVVEPVTKVADGVTLIRLPIRLWWKRFKIAKGKTRAILKLQPDVVYSWDPRSYQTVMLSLASWFAKFKLFSAVHTVASVYPAYASFGKWSIGQKIYLRLTDTLLGWIAFRRIAVCYATTPDAAEISLRFFGGEKEKIRHLPLGLDTRHFYPCKSDDDRVARRRVRIEYGFGDDELICIYTGRMTPAKNPECLAAAIGILRKQGHKFRGIFLGEGEQGEAIAAVEGCKVVSFKPYADLAAIYRAADIGVWPRQESISMTDAAACGLPIVVSDQMKAVERIDGNGLSYKENDASDLARVLLQLADPKLRTSLGGRGAEKMQGAFSIDRMASVLVKDFATAIER